MKYIFIVFVVAFSFYGVAEAAQKLIKATEIAVVGIDTNSVSVSKIVDGDTTCYIARHKNIGFNSISCVK